MILRTLRKKFLPQRPPRKHKRPRRILCKSVGDFLPLRPSRKAQETTEYSVFICVFCANLRENFYHRGLREKHKRPRNILCLSVYSVQVCGRIFTTEALEKNTRDHGIFCVYLCILCKSAGEFLPRCT